VCMCVDLDDVVCVIVVVDGGCLVVGCGDCVCVCVCVSVLDRRLSVCLC